MNSKLFEESSWNYYISVIPIMLFFIIFMIWASISEVEEVVRGSGKVVPSGKTKILQNFEGGIIAEIKVSEGEVVKKGQVIYTLSNAFFKADSISKKMDLLSYKAREIRLKAFIDNKKKITFPKEMRKKIPDIIANEKRIFNEDVANNKNTIDTARNQLKQKEYKLIEVNTKLSNLIIELNLAQENMKIQDTLYRNKVVSKKQYINELSKKQNIVTRLSETRNNIPIIKEQIKEANYKIDTVKSEIRSRYLNKYSIYKAEINKLIEKNRANSDRELRKFVISPVNGIINKLFFYTLGGIVKAGDKMAEITPIDTSLTIEAKIPTSSRALIWKDQKVSVEITAYDFSKYGLLEGKLISISPDSFEDRSGNVFYLVKVKVKVNNFAPDLPILAGMVANINILSGSKTILEYILKPLKNINKNALSEK